MPATRQSPSTIRDHPGILHGRKALCTIRTKGTRTDSQIGSRSVLFPNAGARKPFLAMLLAILIGDGLIDWDDPVHKHVPNFRLSDPLADQNITIRDLLCHRTGLSRHDLLWFKSPLEPLTPLALTNSEATKMVELLRAHGGTK